MATQAEIELQKAIQTTESMASAGKLNPRQAETFLDYVFDLSAVKNMCRQVRFRNKDYDIDEVTLGNRVAMAKSEASDPQKRRSVGHRKITLTPEAITVPIEISKEYLMQNLQGESMEERILMMMAKQFANDQEELYMLGNKLGPAALANDLFPGSGEGYIKDSYLGLQDGWSLLAESGNVLDAEGANISPTIFSEALQALPEKYQRDISSMRFLLPTKLNYKYNEKISQRESGLGDEVLRGAGAPTFGVPRMPFPLWGMHPLVVEHVTLTGTDNIQLANEPVSEIVAVTSTSLGETPTAAYALTTDYTVNLANGTIARVNGGAISDGQTVKVTYKAYPQMLFTNMNNLITGISMDIEILEGREIFKNVYQYVMHLRAGVQIQNKEAVVKVKNIGIG